jgi:hypothetical protein
MIWEFTAVQHTDSKALIAEFREIMICGLEQWIEDYELELVEMKEVQPEAGIEEFPRGFYHEGPSYSFRCRVYGPGGCLDPAEYDVKVEQVFYPKFDREVYEKQMKKRTRWIDSIPSIE